MAAITVIIPCYNTHAYLPDVLRSLECQTFRDFKTILINDGSTQPDTLAYLQTLPNWVRVIHQENKGLPAARNAGFLAADTAYVLPLDADDTIAPEFLARAHEGITANPKAGFTYPFIQMHGDASGVLKGRYYFFQQLFFNKIPYCILLPKRVWEELGGYDESMRQGYEDWDFNIRLGIAGYRGHCLEAPLFHYYVSQRGMLRSRSHQRHAEIWSLMQRKNPDAYRASALLAAWWRDRHSLGILSLFVCFGWLLALRILPRSGFAYLFRFLLYIATFGRTARALWKKINKKQRN